MLQMTSSCSQSRQFYYDNKTFPFHCIAQPDTIFHDCMLYCIKWPGTIIGPADQCMHANLYLLTYQA